MNENRLPPEFYTILDECLDAVTAGRLTVEQCLVRYPQFAEALKPQLQAALLVSRLKSPVFAPVDVLEARLRAHMVEKTPRRIIAFAGWQVSRAAAMLMIAFFLMLGSGAGVVSASASSLPGDPLYGIKRLWESIILLIAPLTGQLDDVWLHLAETRLDEVLRLQAEGRLTEEALVGLYEATANAIALADVSTAPYVTSYTLRARQSLAVMSPLLRVDSLLKDLLDLMDPVTLPDGQLQAPAFTQPPSLLSADAQMTLTAQFTPPTPLLPSATYTLVPSITPSVTPSLTPTATLTDTPEPTDTPRIPPTATRTPTPSATPTLTPSPTLTPTQTWTPLPLPSGIGEPTDIPTQAVASPVPFMSSTPTGSGGVFPFVRQTQQSVYMTQTAIAQTNTAP